MTAFLEAFDAKEWNGFKRDWFNQRAFNKCLSMPCFKGQKLQKLQQIEEFLQEGLQDAADSAASHQSPASWLNIALAFFFFVEAPSRMGQCRSHQGWVVQS